MVNPSIVILHKMHNRVRVKISLPIRNEENVRNMIMNTQGIKSFEYSPITKSILVYFDHSKIELEEVIIKITIAFSKEYGLIPINIISKHPTRDMPKIAFYAAISIAAASASLAIRPNKNVQELLNWIAVGSTTGAVMDHAWMEIKKKGAFDPEVVSVMYLINSVFKGNYINSSALTWLTTFGRHIISPTYDEIKLKVYEVRDKKSNDIDYDIEIIENDNIDNAVDFFKTFASKCIQKNDTSFRNRRMYSEGILNCKYAKCIKNY
ncbi:hypothetical protein [Tepidibacter hydrothermalis]|uniref:Uncharacterized protein n=1 Tax=Tepidibacter hydrothermalis TaxID=3036126 RepID=A0ABY8EDF4_9FIRM|nr:hypothetical protein [Tepidibacter hydrothermalis]WFD09925.1 hypothetical protein P4S50_16330 [Tepidibacter hydrothermalis]